VAKAKLAKSQSKSEIPTRTIVEGEIVAIVKGEIVSCAINFPVVEAK